MLELKYWHYLRMLKADNINTVTGATRRLEQVFNLTHEEAKKIVAEWNRIYGFTD